MYPAPTRHPPAGAPPAGGGPLKFTIAETLERIKEEFNFLQAQYHSQHGSIASSLNQLHTNVIGEVLTSNAKRHEVVEMV